MRRTRGFSLAECVAALAVLGLTLLISWSVVGRGPLAARRLAARRATVEAAQNALEGVRSGLLPLESGPIRLPEGLALTSASVKPEVTLVVKPAQPSGLYEVEVEARLADRGTTVRRKLATFVWRPR